MQPPSNDNADDDHLERLISASKEEPFCSSVKSFRDLVQKEEKNGRLSNPSAEDASRRAERLRLRFSKEVDDKLLLWTKLSSDQQDEFICRMFLPHVLGGLFEDDASGLRHEVGSDDDHSEKNAYRCSGEEDICEISSIESDRANGEDG